MGGFLADAVTYGLPLDAGAYPAKIAATTPQSLQAAAVATLGAERAYVVVVGESAAFIDALRARHPDLVVISAADLDLGSATLGL